MKNISSPLLPFKLETTKDKITPHAGLGLFGEFLYSQRISELFDELLPRRKSPKSYMPSMFALPLLLTMHGGGRHIEDIRDIENDNALCELLQQAKVPSSNATGDWFRFIGSVKKGLLGMKQLNRHLLRRALKRLKLKGFTLDIDATQIIAEKLLAKVTYKGEQGYMPIVAHIAETGMVLHDDFREGNISPGSENLNFIKKSIANMPKGKKVTKFRADAATYIAEVFNYLEEKGIYFAIGGRKDAAIMEMINGLKKEDWREYQKTSHIASFTHTMNDTKKAFRMIVIKRPYQSSFDPDEDKKNKTNSYRVIATSDSDRNEEDIVKWYNQRANASENKIKELKIGFNMEYMPFGTKEANAVYFRLGTIAYNLFKLFQMKVLPSEWKKHTVQTIRWKFYQKAAKLVRHAGQLFMKIKEADFNIFEEVRSKIRTFAMATF
jgi:hypothetical protein